MLGKSRCAAPLLTVLLIPKHYNQPVSVPLALAKLSGDALQVVEFECAGITEGAEAAQILFASLKGG